MVCKWPLPNKLLHAVDIMTSYTLFVPSIEILNDKKSDLDVYLISMNFYKFEIIINKTMIVSHIISSLHSANARPCKISWHKIKRFPIWCFECSEKMRTLVIMGGFLKSSIFAITALDTPETSELQKLSALFLCISSNFDKNIRIAKWWSRPVFRTLDVFSFSILSGIAYTLSAP